MKLHDVPRRTIVRTLAEVTVPPAAPAVGEGELIRFYNLDGMYSRCRNEAGEIVHMHVCTEVEKVMRF